MRKAIRVELGYNASCGISHNKTLAKLASANNKPNAQTVVPQRYMKQVLKDVKISSVRMCGGKVGDTLNEAGVETMGQI
jgi:nucleotidyltransferase/DNA polymerase involved in DNA repair